MVVAEPLPLTGYRDPKVLRPAIISPVPWEAPVPTRHASARTLPYGASARRRGGTSSRVQAEVAETEMLSPFSTTAADIHRIYPSLLASESSTPLSPLAVRLSPLAPAHHQSPAPTELPAAPPELGLHPSLLSVHGLPNARRAEVEDSGSLFTSVSLALFTDPPPPLHRSLLPAGLPLAEGLAPVTVAHTEKSLSWRAARRRQLLRELRALGGGGAAVAAGTDPGRAGHSLPELSQEGPGRFRLLPRKLLLEASVMNRMITPPSRMGTPLEGGRPSTADGQLTLRSMWSEESDGGWTHFVGLDEGSSQERYRQQAVQQPVGSTQPAATPNPRRPSMSRRASLGGLHLSGSSAALKALEQNASTADGYERPSSTATSLAASLSPTRCASNSSLEAEEGGAHSSRGEAEDGGAEELQAITSGVAHAPSFGGSSATIPQHRAAGGSAAGDGGKEKNAVGLRELSESCDVARGASLAPVEEPSVEPSTEASVLSEGSTRGVMSLEGGREGEGEDLAEDNAVDKDAVLWDHHLFHRCKPDPVLLGDAWEAVQEFESKLRVGGEDVFWTERTLAAQARLQLDSETLQQLRQQSTVWAGRTEEELTRGERTQEYKDAQLRAAKKAAREAKEAAMAAAKASKGKSRLGGAVARMRILMPQRAAAGMQATPLLVAPTGEPGRVSVHSASLHSSAATATTTAAAGMATAAAVTNIAMLEMPTPTTASVAGNVAAVCAGAGDSVNAPAHDPRVGAGAPADAAAPISAVAGRSESDTADSGGGHQPGREGGMERDLQQLPDTVDEHHDEEYTNYVVDDYEDDYDSDVGGGKTAGPTLAEELHALRSLQKTATSHQAVVIASKIAAAQIRHERSTSQLALQAFRRSVTVARADVERAVNELTQPLGRQRIAELNLDNAHLAPPDLALLGKALTYNTSLTTLSLFNNGVDGAACAALVDGLRIHPTLTALNLHNNDVGAEGARAVAQMLLSNTSVVDINLSNNWLGDQGAQELDQALKFNCTLERLDLQANHITDRACGTLVQTWTRTPQLQSMRLAGNFMTLATTRKYERARLHKMGTFPDAVNEGVPNLARRNLQVHAKREAVNFVAGAPHATVTSMYASTGGSLASRSPSGSPNRARGYGATAAAAEDAALTPRADHVRYWRERHGVRGVSPGPPAERLGPPRRMSPERHASPLRRGPSRPALPLGGVVPPPQLPLLLPSPAGTPPLSPLVRSYRHPAYAAPPPPPPADHDRSSLCVQREVLTLPLPAPSPVVANTLPSHAHRRTTAMYMLELERAVYAEAAHAGPAVFGLPATMEVQRCEEEVGVEWTTREPIHPELPLAQRMPVDRNPQLESDIEGATDASHY